jgi:hypothetical protein
MRTRRLHARLAYVMRVENRASVAYAAASSSARTPRPPRVAYAKASCCLRLRGKKKFAVGLRIARMACVMHYSLGTLAHIMRTRRLHARLCARLGKAFGARPNPATITYNAKAPELAARQRVLFCDMMNWDPRHQRMAANSARVSGPMHLPCTVKLRSSVLYRQVK